MSKKTNDMTPSFARGALWGFIIGGIVALWNAPQSGKRTRHQLGRILHIVQGQSVEEALDEGKMIAQQNRANAAEKLD